MNSNELFNVFVTKRANAGDKFAQKHLKEEKITQLLLKIESLGMAMQMEFSRIQGTSLHQIKTKEATTGLANPPNSTISPMQIDLAPIDKGNKYKKIQPFTRCNLLLLFNYFSNFG